MKLLSIAFMYATSWKMYLLTMQMLDVFGCIGYSYCFVLECDQIQRSIQVLNCM